ncbi:hypothetical protein Taro_029269 [Colocasia esculenta]|uniref:Uncharacterized protein n=1 Tax=Colocasia esculenta TaxID=4460 RepID=A0A843VIJ7_COLES|nr:hypothetical protein [Colocasia esculenta]
MEFAYKMDTKTPVFRYRLVGVRTTESSTWESIRAQRKARFPQVDIIAGGRIEQKRRTRAQGDPIYTFAGLRNSRIRGGSGGGGAGASIRSSVRPLDVSTRAPDADGISSVSMRLPDLSSTMCQEREERRGGGALGERGGVGQREDLELGPGFNSPRIFIDTAVFHKNPVTVYNDHPAQSARNSIACDPLGPSASPIFSLLSRITLY